MTARLHPGQPVTVWGLTTRVRYIVPVENGPALVAVDGIANLVDARQVTPR